MTNRPWHRVVLLALLALTLAALPAATRAAAPTALLPLPFYAYNCSIVFGDLAPDGVTCNGVTYPRYGAKHFYTASVAPGKTISISGTVTGSSTLIIRNTGYLRIESVTGSAVSEWREINKSGTVSWQNTTGATQQIKLTWQSNGPFSSYKVQGLVWIH